MGGLQGGNQPNAAADPNAPDFANSVGSSGEAPTLRVGDIVLVNKWVYRWRRPRRGETVVYNVRDFAPYTARVIGLAGDTVCIAGGTVYLNEKELPRRRVGPLAFDSPSGKESGTLYRETLPSGKTYGILHLDGASAYGDHAVVSVPPHHVFLLGDNRDNVVDSRSDMIGFVPLDALVGHVYTRLIPAGRPLDEDDPDS